MSTGATLRTEARRLREAARRLELTASALRENALELEDRARELDGTARQVEDTILRGRVVDDKAFGVIGDGEAHYTDIHAALADAGYVVTGQSPKDTLLAILGRDERFESVRPRSGLYRRRKASA